MTRRLHVDVPAPALGGAGTVIVHGHCGRPVLVFPSERRPGLGLREQRHGRRGRGRCSTTAGCKLYCVDSLDAGTWSDRSLSIEERARRHAEYDAWIIDSVRAVDHRDDCGGRQEIGTIGCSSWAPTTRCTSRSSGPTCSRWRSACPATTTRRHWHAWGERGDATYFANPTDYVPDLRGDHLDWLRSPAVDPARRRAGGLGGPSDGLAAVDPPDGRRCCRRRASAASSTCGGTTSAHDWPWWQRQLAHHLPRFC